MFGQVDPGAIGNLLASGGPWALLVVSVMTGWLVPKYVLDRTDKRVAQLEEDNKELRALLYRTAHVAETTVELASKGVK